MHAAEIPNLQSYNEATPMLRQISAFYQPFCQCHNQDAIVGPHLAMYPELCLRGKGIPDRSRQQSFRSCSPVTNRCERDTRQHTTHQLGSCSV